jgi:hypothetical protein
LKFRTKKTDFTPYSSFERFHIVEIKNVSQVRSSDDKNKSFKRILNICNLFRLPYGF